MPKNFNWFLDWFKRKNTKASTFTEIILENNEYDDTKFEVVSIESKIRQGVFHKVVKNLETGKAVSCSCKCWSKGNKPCFGMKTIGYSE